MTQPSVNLIIQKETESLLIRRLKVIAPISALVSLFLFGIAYLISYMTTSSSLASFNQLKREIAQYENKINAQKNTEGIYTLTLTRLNILSELAAKNRNLFNVITTFDELPTAGINITSVAVNTNGSIGFTIIASDSAALDTFVTQLLEQEQQKNVSRILSSGTLRDRKGNYTVGITMKGEPVLYQ